MVINHLLNGMILQVSTNQPLSPGGTPGVGRWAFKDGKGVEPAEFLPLGTWGVGFLDGFKGPKEGGPQQKHEKTGWNKS